MRTIRYGHESADLHLPTVPHPPVVCLLHGGFWRMPHGRDQMDAVARDLAAHGFAVWNLEYRRLGAPRVEWPMTLDDVAAGIDHLAQLAEEGVDLDLDRVAVAGHSAGGHLALWAAARDRARPRSRVVVHCAAGLAPIADLAHAHATRVGGDVVAELLGGTPDGQRARLEAASPMEMLPLGTRQLIVHGTADDVVPVELSRRYARAAQAAGDDVELVELEGAGHMEFLDPRSAAHATLRRWLLARLGEPRSRGAAALVMRDHDSSEDES